MRVGGWIAGALALGAVVVLAWPSASPPLPVVVEASPAARRTPAATREHSFSDEEPVAVLERSSAQRERTLEAEDALAERSERARAALIKRQRTRLRRLVDSAELEDNPARTRILRQRLDDLERMAEEPSE